MTTTVTNHTRDRLEADELAAYRDRERSGTVAADRAYDDAWEKLRQWCHDNAECQQSGCRAKVTDWAYCPKHRDA